MKKMIRRLFAMLVALAIAFTAIPVMQVKAEVNAGPVISNVEMSEAGEVLEVGDVITITADVEGEYLDGAHIAVVMKSVIGDNEESFYKEMRHVSGDTYSVEIEIDESRAETMCGREWYV